MCEERSVPIYVWKLYPTVFPNRLDTGHDRQERVKDNSRLLTLATGRMELPSPEMRKTVARQR